MSTNTNIEQSTEHKNVLIRWRNKYGEEDQGQFPADIFLGWLSANLGQKVSVIAKEFVEDWCGLEGQIDRIIRMEVA